LNEGKTSDENPGKNPETLSSMDSLCTSDDITNSMLDYQDAIADETTLDTLTNASPLTNKVIIPVTHPQIVMSWEKYCQMMIRIPLSQNYQIHHEFQ
jgi:hypothetical protein